MAHVEFTSLGMGDSKGSETSARAGRDCVVANNIRDTGYLTASIWDRGGM